MYQPLVPCPQCRRHVRTAEGACPFCNAVLPADLARAAVPGAKQRLTRAAAFAFTASLAVTGCGSEVTGPEGASGAQGGTGGGAGTGTSGATGSTSTTGTGFPDAGPDDDGGNQTLYGDPVPIDGGPDDDGGGGAKYGAPPVDAG